MLFSSFRSLAILTAIVSSIPLGLTSPVAEHQLQQRSNTTSNEEFPAGRMPPGQIFDYTVGFTDPPIVIAFHSWKLVNFRNDTAAQHLVQQEIRKYSDPSHREDIIDQIKYVGEGGVTLWVNPARPTPEVSSKPLKYGDWLNALIGIGRFVDAYPHLDTSYVIYSLASKTFAERYNEGVGSIFTDDAQIASSDATTSKEVFS